MEFILELNFISSASFPELFPYDSYEASLQQFNFLKLFSLLKLLHMTLARARTPTHTHTEMLLVVK
jgi:hypothetical protein